MLSKKRLVSSNRERKVTLTWVKSFYINLILSTCTYPKYSVYPYPYIRYPILPDQCPSTSLQDSAQVCTKLEF